MQENHRLVMLNGNLTDDEIMRAIRYLDPDLFAEKDGEDAGTVLGICITLLTALAGTLTYIYLYYRHFESASMDAVAPSSTSRGAHAAAGISLS